MITETTTRLLELLRAETGNPELAYAAEPEPLRGGFWAELLTFSVAGAPAGWPARLVARLMPDEALARKETIVQRAVADAGYPTPAVRAAGDAAAGLGRAYMVMDHGDGAPLLADLDGVGALRRGPRIARRLPAVLAGSMVALHALDPEPIRAELAAAPDVTVDGLGMLEQLRRGAHECGRADLEAAAKALATQDSGDHSEVICHGDLHPFNVLVDDNGAITVLDWSAAILAPRTYDVAFTALMVAEPPLLLPPALRRPVRAFTRGLAARFVRCYERAASVTIDPGALTYFQAVVCLRALVEVGEWVTGGTVDGRAGHPWLTNGEQFAARLSAATGVDVRAR